MTDCFWCQEVFNEVDHDTCPNCAVNTDTKSIKIVPTGKEDE